MGFSRVAGEINTELKTVDFGIVKIPVSNEYLHSTNKDKFCIVVSNEYRLVTNNFSLLKKGSCIA